mmetsp:Transcript_70745/g.207204  ORF Transcript_70745/g.207204 Transcript_70745/m.207204 type:complete len:205 (+) Transcript_70745:122-736(+)
MRGSPLGVASSGAVGWLGGLRDQVLQLVRVALQLVIDELEDLVPHFVHHLAEPVIADVVDRRPPAEATVEARQLAVAHVHRLERSVAHMGWEDVQLDFELQHDLRIQYLNACREFRDVGKMFEKVAPAFEGCVGIASTDNRNVRCFEANKKSRTVLCADTEETSFRALAFLAVDGVDVDLLQAGDVQCSAHRHVHAAPVHLEVL